MHGTAANLLLSGSHKNAKHLHHPLPFKETDVRPAWSQSEFGEAKRAVFTAQDCGFCYFHCVYFVEEACERNTSSLGTSWICPLAVWCETKGAASLSSLVGSSHVTFNNSQISLHKQLQRCEGLPAADAPVASDVWGGQRSQISTNLWAPLCQVRGSWQ